MKNYKIIRLVPSIYNCIVQSLLKEHPYFQSFPYAKQQEIYFSKKYVYTDAFSREMKKLGNEAQEIVFDFEIMQKTWAKENGFHLKDPDWKKEIVLKQIETLKPQIIYIQGCNGFNDLLPQIKTDFPFVRLIIKYSGFPQNEPRDLDLLFVGYPILQRHYAEKGLVTHLIYHSFDPSVLSEGNGKNPAEKQYDFTFMGSSGFGYGAGHHSRYWGLVDLLLKTDIQLWLQELLARKSLYQKDNGFFPPRFTPMWPLSETFPEQCSQGVFGQDLYSILTRSKCTFNLHPEFAAYHSMGNMRLFEATGVGTCLLTDRGANVHELFEEDHEIVTYDSMDECIEKAQTLLEKDDLRKSIAEKGQRRTLKDHTCENRCRQIDQIIQTQL